MHQDEPLLTHNPLVPGLSRIHLYRFLEHIDSANREQKGSKSPSNRFNRRSWHFQPHVREFRADRGLTKHPEQPLQGRGHWIK